MKRALLILLLIAQGAAAQMWLNSGGEGINWAISQGQTNFHNSDIAAVGRFVKRARENGYWTNLLDVGLLMGENLPAKLLKLKSFNGSVMTNIGYVAADFTGTNGLQGQTNKILDTGFVWSDWGGGAIGLSAWLLDDPTNGRDFTLIGKDNGSSNYLQQIFTWTASGSQMNWNGYLYGVGTVVQLPIPSAGRGFWHAMRSNDSYLSAHINGVFVKSNTTTVITNTAQRTLAVGSGRNSSGASGYSTNRIGFYAIDDGQMGNARATNFAADVRELMKDLGRLRLRPTMNIVLVVGQSLAVGTGGGVALSTNTVRGWTVINGPAGLIGAGQGTNAQSIILPMASQATTETPWPAMAETVAMLSRQDGFTDEHDITILNYAVGGNAYASLKKGTQNYTALTNGLSLLVRNAQPYWADRFIVRAVACMHGESDRNDTNYHASLDEWQKDIQTDAKAITGQTNDVPFFLTQPSFATNLTGAASALAVLRAHETNSLIRLVAPNYTLTYGDDVHLTNFSYRLIGEYFGRAYHRQIIQGIPWEPLRPTSLTVSETVITVTLTGTYGTLHVDDLTVFTNLHAGFSYTDDSGNPITNRELSGTNFAIVTIGGGALGANPRLRFALTPTNGFPGFAAGLRGNIRDTNAPTGPLSGNPLFQWMVHFDKPVPWP